MLSSTFIHIPGIGRATEQVIWKSGIRNWSDALESGRLSGRLGRIREGIKSSQEALATKDASFFSKLIGMGEAWRMYRDFADDCVFLDIETTGLSAVFDTITVVGLYDGNEYRVFVEGRNMDKLQAALEHYKVVVTFNGAQFDLRFLRTAFSSMKLPPVHVDLRWVTAKLGLTGGLKEVEAALGISRPKHVAGLNGYDATVLWSRYKRGDESALRFLVDYNAQDVINLKRIMDISFDRMSKATASFIPRNRNFSTPSRKRLPSNTLPAQATVIKTTKPVVDRLIELARARREGIRVVGIDLTGSERRASGWALLEGQEVTTSLIRMDAELVERTIATRPDFVSIDSPLSLPGGFADPDACTRAGFPIYRACELGLKRMGISVFWCLLPSMKSLTMRGIALTQQFRAAGLKVIESYPGAAQDLLQIPRKGTSLQELKHGLHRAGIRGRYIIEKTSHDEVDAITSALVGLFYAAGEHISLGNPVEDYLIVPRSPQINYDRLAIILAATGLDAVSRETTHSTPILLSA